MNSAQVKCLAVFGIFAIIGFGPISPGCLIGMYIVLRRPRWFLELTDNLYGNPSAVMSAGQAKKTRIRAFLCLLVLFIIDIAPVPVTPVVAFAIILSKPIWFYRMVKTIYTKSVARSKEENSDEI